MKKFLALILALLMVLSLVACGSNDPGSEGADNTDKPYAGVELNVLDVSYAPTNGLIEYIPEFEEMTGIKVNVETNAYADVNTKKEVELSAGSNAYDVMHICSATVNRLAGAGWVEDLTPYIEASPDYDYEDIIEFARDTFKVGDGCYGVPVSCETHLLYYRADVLEDLGIAVPTTVDELMAACEKIKAERSDISPIVLRGIAGQGANMFIIPTFMYSAGGGYYNDDQTALALNSEATVKGISTYANLLQNYAPAGAANFSYTDAYTSFAQGEAAFLIDSSGLTGILNDPENSKVTDVWNCAAVFPNEENSSCVAAFAHGLCINTYSDKKDAAWEYIKWYTGKQMEQRLGEEVKHCGTARVSSRQSDAYMEALGDNDWVQAFADSVPNARSDHRLLSLPEWAYIGDTMGTAINDAVANNKDIQATMDELQNTMTDFFKQEGYLK